MLVPMISSLEEIQKVKELLGEAKHELTRDGTALWRIRQHINQPHDTQCELFCPFLKFVSVHLKSHQSEISNQQSSIQPDPVV